MTAHWTGQFDFGQGVDVAVAFVRHDLSLIFRLAGRSLDMYDADTDGFQLGLELLRRALAGVTTDEQRVDVLVIDRQERPIAGCVTLEQVDGEVANKIVVETDLSAVVEFLALRCEDLMAVALRQGQRVGVGVGVAGRPEWRPTADAAIRTFERCAVVRGGLGRRNCDWQAGRCSGQNRRINRFVA